MVQVLGRSGVGNFEVLDIVGDPSALGLDAPRWSLAFDENGHIWRKESSLSTDWTDETGGGGGGANTFLSNLTAPTAVNQDLIFNKASPAEVKTADDGGLIPGDSSDLILESGDITVAASPDDSGDTTMKSGDVTDTGSSGNTGAVTVKSGDNAGTGNSGDLNLLSGDTVSGATGAVAIISGSHSGASADPTGDLTLASGDQVDAGSAGPTGNIAIATGSNAGSNQSGGISLETGINSGSGPTGDITIAVGAVTGVASGGSGGSVSISGGNVTDAGSTNGAGSVSLFSGSNDGTGDSGPINLSTGDNGGIVGDTGSISLVTGLITAGGSAGNTGDISLASGTNAGAGLRGDLNIDTRAFNIPSTITPAGTTGDQVINNMSGTVNFAAGSDTLVVTNDRVTVNSLIFAMGRTTANLGDTVGAILSVDPAAGSFTIVVSPVPNIEQSVGWWVVN